MSETGNAAAAVMYHLVTHYAHGYTQGSGRWGNGITETIDYRGIDIYFASGDRDCASACVSTWQAVGKVVGHDLTGGATFTGDMVGCWDYGAAGTHEILVGGSLPDGASAGAGTFRAANALASASWYFGGRPSTIGHSAPAE